MTARLSLPLLLNDAGDFVTIAEDSPEATAQSVALLLDTRPGERRAVPEYGFPNPLGQPVDETRVRAVISEWEPAADPATVTAVLSSDTRSQQVTVTPGQADVDFA